MQPKNTNNSLTDIINLSINFTEKSDNTKNKNLVEDNDKNKEVSKKLADNPNLISSDKITNEDSISNTQQRKKTEAYYNTTAFNSNDMKSLFDSKAYIDYGRYTNSGDVDLKWEHYHQNSEGEFINNSKIINKNIPVLYRDNLDNEDGLSLPNLITWSEKYKALQLRFQDFVYCKLLGYYPNNRLIILRRFKSGVPDNLFDYVNLANSDYTTPLATMITWWKPEDELGKMTYKFAENWKTYSTSIVDTLKNITNNTKTDDKENIINDTLTAVFLENNELLNPLKKEDGLPFTKSAMGSPNLIKKAKAREVGGEGLSSKISFSIEFEYELRDINGIDPSIAMLDLIANCHHMGTSTSEFRYNTKIVKDSEFLAQLISGDVEKASKSFVDGIIQLTKDLGVKLENSINIFESISKISTDSVLNFTKTVTVDSAKYIISRYRENLRAALASDTGLPSGIWHITIGNPKAPVISCGDLIITESALTLGKELGYNDFPNEFKITISLESARERGRDELTRIFNSGRGRIYTYPKVSDNPDYDL